MAPTRITEADPQATIESYPEEIRNDANKLRWQLAVSIIMHFLGRDWVLKNFPQDDKRPGFFRLDFSSDVAREHKTARILDFAETLYNLQHIEGFDSRIDQMRTADAESTYAEFDFAKFLYGADVSFKFVVPSGVAGKDYDYLVTYSDRRTACADAKCRVEGEEINPAALGRILESARSKSLPRDEPGLIFVKVPQEWIDASGVLPDCANVVQNFLRQTERVVSVVVYAPIIQHSEGIVSYRYLMGEFDNNKHRFDMSMSWRVFDNIGLPVGADGMPHKWHRILSQGREQ